MSNNHFPIFFLKYKEKIVKVRRNEIHSQSNYFTVLKQKFPNKIFPSDCVFINENLNSPANQNLSKIENGHVIRVTPPRPKLVDPKERIVVLIRNFPPQATSEELKLLLGLDESTDDKNLIFIDDIVKDVYERTLFVELNDEEQLERILNKNGNNLGSKRILKVEKADGETKKFYLKEKQRYSVVYVENIPNNALSADLRILFSKVPIYAIHVMRNEKAFIELNDDNVLDLLRYDGISLSGKKISLTESDYPSLLSAININRKNQKLEIEEEKEISFNKSKPFFDDGEIENEIINVNEKKMYERATNDYLDQKPRYENKDFKCLLISSMPSGTSDLDIARFFDDVKVQPIIMHRKIDGTSAYCEFVTVKDCDKAVSLNGSKLGTTPVQIFRVRHSELIKSSQNKDFIKDDKDIEKYRISPKLNPEERIPEYKPSSNNNNNINNYNKSFKSNFSGTENLYPNKRDKVEEKPFIENDLSHRNLGFEIRPNGQNVFAFNERKNSSTNYHLNNKPPLNTNVYASNIPAGSVYNSGSYYSAPEVAEKFFRENAGITANKNGYSGMERNQNPYSQQFNNRIQYPHIQYRNEDSMRKKHRFE